MNLPVGIAVDNSGSVYVVDQFNMRVAKFTEDGTPIMMWPVGEPYRPSYATFVTVGPTGLVFVSVTTSAQSQRIIVFTTTGGIAQFIATDPAGPDLVFSPAGIAVDAEGNVYVGDVGGQRIVKFSAAGDVITTWPTGPVPIDLALSPLGQIYVVSRDGSRIEVYDRQGLPLFSWGSHGTGDGQFSSPTGIGIDQHGNVFVADRKNHRVQKFTHAGDYLTKWGGLGSGDGEFSFPADVAINAEGLIFVTDRNNHRVQVFGDPSTPSAATSWGRIKSIYRD